MDTTATTASKPDGAVRFSGPASDHRRGQGLLGGATVRGKVEPMAIATTDPRNGEVIKDFDELTPEQLEDKLARAAAAAERYRTTTHEERAGWLRAAADLLDKRTDEVAEMMTLEIGKCSAVLRYYADNAAGFLADETVDAGAVNATRAYAHYLPIGVVLAIMP